MRVVIYGSGRWRDAELVRQVLRALPAGTVIVRRTNTHGAEEIAEREARAVGLEVASVALNMYRFGHKAALERDLAMLEGADRVIVFRSVGVSMDTDRMIWLAAKKGVNVLVHHGGGGELAAGG